MSIDIPPCEWITECGIGILVLVIAGVTMQSGDVPLEIGIVNGRSSPRASETAVTVRQREGKSGEVRGKACEVLRGARKSTADFRSGEMRWT